MHTLVINLTKKSKEITEYYTQISQQKVEKVEILKQEPSKQLIEY